MQHAHVLVYVVNNSDESSDSSERNWPTKIHLHQQLKKPRMMEHTTIIKQYFGTGMNWGWKWTFCTFPHYTRKYYRKRRHVVIYAVIDNIRVENQTIIAPGHGGPRIVWRRECHIVETVGSQMAVRLSALRGVAQCPPWITLLLFVFEAESTKGHSADCRIR
jgi:hypothetical protein